MTCPGCSREVTLIGGLCGRCSSRISRGVSEAIEDLDFQVEIVDVSEHEDSYYHARFDLGGESA